MIDFPGFSSYNNYAGNNGLLSEVDRTLWTDPGLQNTKNLIHIISDLVREVNRLTQLVENGNTLTAIQIAKWKIAAGENL